MKIVFVGTVDFSFYCLSILIQKSAEVCGIVTSTNKSVNSDYKDLSSIALENNIPIHYCKNINDNETVEWISNKVPDIIFCWGWSQLIKPELLSVPPMGVVGVHPALLPLNRGRHPIIWALILGLEKTGLSFFFMDEGADSGPILSQQEITIDTIDTATTLYEKVKVSAKYQIAKFLPQLIKGTYNRIPQELEVANYWRKRSKEDGNIDWRMSSAAIYNLVRGLAHPYPGAQFIYKGHSIVVWKASIYNSSLPLNIEPGKIIKVVNNKPIIKCYDGAIILEEYESVSLFCEGDYII